MAHAQNRNVVSYDHDGMVERNRFIRWTFMILVFSTTLFLTGAFGVEIGKLTELKNLDLLGGALGVSLGVYIVLKIFPRFWVVVPQTSAFVTVNMFSSAAADPNVPYGPGGHPAFPWELRTESGNMTLDIMTFSFEEEVPTKDTMMQVKGTVQFKFALERITTVVGIDITTIEQGFIAQINEWFSNRLSSMSGADSKDSVTSLREEIETEFEETRREMLLTEYGILVTGFQVASIDFPKAVQEVRDAVEEAARIGENIWKMMGFTSQAAFDKARENGTITEDAITRARDDILAASGNIKKEVRRIDITGMAGAGIGGQFAAGMFGSDKS